MTYFMTILFIHNLMRFAMFPFLLALSLVAIQTAISQAEGRLNWLELTWILQSRGIQSDGFLIEFMGFADELRSRFPLATVTKSFFNTSLEEDPIHDRTTFFERDLNDKEKHAMHGLLSSHVDGSVGRLKYAPSLFFKEHTSLSDSMCGNTSLREDVSIFSRLTKFHSTVSSTDNAMDCCRACTEHPSCMSWGYSSTSGCQLYRRHDGKVVTEQSLHTLQYGEIPMQQRIPKPRAFVFHGTTCSVYNTSVRALVPRDANNIYIGRYMVERSDFSSGMTLDEFAVLSCIQHMDELWVPTEWHKQVFERYFRRSGGRGPIMTIVPEAVDTTFFSPTAQTAVSFLPYTESSLAIDGSSDVAGDHGGEVFFVKDPARHGLCVHEPDGSSEDANPPQHGFVRCLQGKTTFDLLSVFKWERRKGWDLLLRAYWTAFTAEDNVRLLLRTYLPNFDRDRTPLPDRILAFAQTEFHVSDLSQLAAVVIIDGKEFNSESESLGMTRTQMRDLYAQADAFVLPSRGEGWGLPAAEAMAMSIPTILSACSGLSAFANEDNSYFIPISEHPDELHFAQPDVPALTAAMRRVVQDSTASAGYAAQRKAGRGRRTMQRPEFSAEHIVDIISTRLQHHAKQRGWDYSKDA